MPDPMIPGGDAAQSEPEAQIPETDGVVDAADAAPSDDPIDAVLETIMGSDGSDDEVDVGDGEVPADDTGGDGSNEGATADLDAETEAAINRLVETRPDLSIEEIQALAKTAPDLLRKLAGPAPEPAETAETTDTKPDAQTEAKPAEPAADTVAMLTKAGFDKAEAEAIARVAASVQPQIPAEFAAATKKIAVLESALERMLLNQARGEIHRLFPDSAKEGEFDRVVARATELTKTRRYSDVESALRDAALLLYGDRVVAHANTQASKRDAAKAAGTMTTRRAQVRPKPPASPEDALDALAQAVVSGETDRDRLQRIAAGSI